MDSDSQEGGASRERGALRGGRRRASRSCQIFLQPLTSLEDGRMERMESMEPISAYYTSSYPEIQPESGYGSTESAEKQEKTPAAPTYDEELVHKVRLLQLKRHGTTCSCGTRGHE